MAARMLAYLYASLTGIVGSFVGYLAGYEAVTTIVLVLHGMAAVAAAMWPPQAKHFDSKWMRQAAAWAERARHRLVKGETLIWKRREAATHIQKFARAQLAKAQYKHLRTAIVRIQANFRGYLCRKDEKVASFCSHLASVLLWPVNRLRNACALARGLATRLGESLAAIAALAWFFSSFGWLMAIGIQLAMAGNGAREVSVLLKYPPLEPANYMIVLVAALVPMLDTLDAAWQVVREQLSARLPSCERWIFAPCAHAILWLLGCVASLLGCMLWPFTAAARAVNEAIKELVSEAIMRKTSIVHAKA
jgi:hypothetical protein